MGEERQGQCDRCKRTYTRRWSESEADHLCPMCGVGDKAEALLYTMRVARAAIKEADDET